MRLRKPSNRPTSMILCRQLSAITVLMLIPAVAFTAEATSVAPKTKAGFQRKAAGMQPVTDQFKPTTAELQAALQAPNSSSEPLSFQRGEGLRILSTGHSWVAPGLTTLPLIAKAAGFSEHRQRSHTSGGGTGSANAIWLSEFGKFRSQPAKPILMPAIATGQWDVMTWGLFHNDKPDVYTQWVEVCLKYNAEMTFYIQDGWPLFMGEHQQSAPDVALQWMTAQSEEIQSGLVAQLHASLNGKYPDKVHIIPAGPALIRMLKHYYAKELPGFDCVSEHLGGKVGIYRDGGHLSAAGGMPYLVGYTYFGMLYKKSPTTLKAFAPKGVHPQVDRLMRAAAWDAITSSPFSGLTDKNANGIADEAER